MSAILANRPSMNGSLHEKSRSVSSFPASAPSSSPNFDSPRKLRSQTSLGRKSPVSSQDSRPRSVLSYSSFQKGKRRCKPQYPANSAELHVEYILVASFHVDRGPIMEHQYPAAISGDENMLAELMLPDQTHVRSQDWTMFFLHRDTGSEDGIEDGGDPQDQEEKAGDEPEENGQDGARQTDDEDSADDDGYEDEDCGDGPPLMYVLNLVNTKQDNSVKRGAVVKAMAICTRHSFLHIYKPLLLLALEDYFKSPYPETLARLYDSLNAMDLSLMPRLSYLERHILQATDVKDMFIEKFERMIKQRLADERAASELDGADAKSFVPLKYTLPRDTHEFESKIIYNDIAIPVKIPTAVSPETVGDFSLIKLIQTFSGPHASSPQAFPLHPHLTTSGAFTHPIIVLVNALLSQKRVIFLGHNRPSGEVAEAVLAACALASGGLLRGFTRHAFPYTDLTKIDELLKVPGFVAGVTNPAFANHHEWWDLLCDLPSGRMKISSRIEAAPATEGTQFFQYHAPLTASSILGGSSSAASDPTGDNNFMDDILRSIASRHGEGAIRAKWRAYITKFTRISAAFEEVVYGATALHVLGPGEDASENQSPLQTKHPDPSILRGHGYVWPDENTKHRELAAWVNRIEGWRNTRSYYYFIQDTAALYPVSKPVQNLDLHHHHDKLRYLKLSSGESGAIYLAFANAIQDYNSICQLISVTPESQAGLFYISLGLFHPDAVVRTATLGLLERIAGHEAGRHLWAQLSRFTKVAYFRMKRDRDGELNGIEPQSALIPHKAFSRQPRIQGSQKLGPCGRFSAVPIAMSWCCVG
ncbi:MesA protein [Uncinocarpus reesii 1704]|uniref:MesA protein n=1 Tax=Uncinocarpus reesii (strain UAMH 1704) TaxID=336963 RepID=C4JVY8_UNCRE|nr:MesA protein [Uncinocarpus reesii 1704]EEP81865.1 MesA protein [Uncinocarpus reesii 1704]